MPAIFSISITLTAQDVPWVAVNPTVTFGAVTATVPAPVSGVWSVSPPTIVQPQAQTVTFTAPVTGTWAVLAPTVYGLVRTPPFTGEVREGGVEAGEVQESPGP